jgi:hypothetical protein
MSLTVVRLSKVLHLKSAVTALPDGTIIGHLPSLDAHHPFHDILPTPDDEVNGAHAVRPDVVFTVFCRCQKSCHSYISGFSGLICNPNRKLTLLAGYTRLQQSFNGNWLPYHARCINRARSGSH